MSGNGSDERKFLHDIANPLGTSMLLLEIVMEDLAKHVGLIPEELNQVGQIREQLERIKTMLVARREVLIARGVPSSRAVSPISEPKSEGK